MIKSIFLLCLFILAGKPVFCQTTHKINRSIFLKNAISEGLRKDRFPLPLAQKIADNSSIFFVTKCPICTPVHSAFISYTHIKTKLKKTKVPADIIERLASPEKTVQQIALRDLIERYVAKAYQKLNASKDSLEALKNDLEMDKKVGTARKKDSFGSFCPSCEGTCPPKK